MLEFGMDHKISKKNLNRHIFPKMNDKKNSQLIILQQIYFIKLLENIWFENE